jgi:membrane protein
MSVARDDMQTSRHIPVPDQPSNIHKPDMLWGGGKHRAMWSRLRLLGKPTAAWTLLKSAISGCLRDNVQRMSAALAYYTIFSLAPLLVIAIAIAGLVFGEKAAQGEIIAELRELLGSDGARAVQAMIVSAHKPVHSALASVFGVMTLLLGATGAFSEVCDALNNIWGVRRDTQKGVWALIRGRFLGIGLVLIVGFLLLVSLVVSAALAGMAKYADRFLPIPAVVLHMLDVLVSVAVITVLFAMIFRMLPDLKITWGDVWVGAALTAVLFTVGKFLIGFYIGKSVSASSYGAAGSLVIVVAWIYYSALILYFGAEFTQVYARKYGSHIGLERKDKLRLD